MKKDFAIKALLLSFVILASLTAVYAARDSEEEPECVVKPTGEISVAAFTEGVSFILAGGIGPIAILIIAFIVGMIISHLLWSGL